MSELIDNRARRVATLKEIIQHLYKGEAPAAVKGQLREIVRQTNPSEIMAMEQELISAGMAIEEVRSMCDLHSQVTREVLMQLPASPTAPGPSYRYVSTGEYGHPAGDREDPDNSCRAFRTRGRS